MSEGGTNTLQAWMPFMTKMVWPVFAAFFFVLYYGEMKQLVSITVERIKSGSEFEIAGIFALGQAARDTQIGNVGPANLTIDAVGGPSGVVRKDSGAYLDRLQADLEKNPSRAIDTLLLVDGTVFSVDLIRQYISSLTLQFVIFTSNGEFDGWMKSSVLMAQIPPDVETLTYSELKSNLVGIRNEFVTSDASAREVLLRMQELRVDSLPVLGPDGQWLFFANQGQVLSRLMTGLLEND